MRFVSFEAVPGAMRFIVPAEQGKADVPDLLKNYEIGKFIGKPLDFLK